MKKLLYTIILFSIATGVHCQPYLDIVGIKYTNSPAAGVWRSNNTENHFQYFNASLNLPVVFKRDSTLLVFSPNTERWDIQTDTASSLPAHFYSLILPLSLVKPLSAKWAITVTAIPRWNGEATSIFKNGFQMGGAVIAAYKKNSRITWKLGLYYNSEQSGPFFMPLAGIDWHINSNNNLFGVLPGSLVFEHKTSSHLYIGAMFKAITNTYLTGQQNRYLRIDDNQVSFFADYYISKKVVLTMESGHSVFRAFRLGIKDAPQKYYYQEKMNDDLLFKISLNYRIRF